MTTKATPSMFEDDDEETWKILVSLQQTDDDSSDISTRLQSLAERLEEDHSTTASYWDELVQKQLPLNGCFRYSTDSMKQRQSSSTSSSSSSDFPVAFQSDLGKKHIQATSALLGLSERRSVQVTMSALRSVVDSDDGSQFQSLLGSRDLLTKTMLHHHQQRMARVAVVTECLRLEQDPEATLQSEAITQFLDSLDSTFQDGDRYRGLFRRLLTIAVAPETPPTRDQLEPSKVLHASASRSLQDSMMMAASTSTGEKGWKAFAGTFLEERHAQIMRERTEAMEALLVLLYDRINGGVRRADYALLLIAFKTSFNFFTHESCGEDGGRLSKLAGIICAESMALWRVSKLGNDRTVGWATVHPLLLGVLSTGNTEAAENEIETLKSILYEYAQDMTNRKTMNNQSSGGEADPEALALLSFGLLLCLASDSISSSDAGGDSQAQWRTFKEIGTEMAQIANSEYSAFDYMYFITDGLTGEATAASRSLAANDDLYDWQFSTAVPNPLLLENGLQDESVPATTAYTSIVLEVLAASVSAFETSILAIHHPNACENIGTLCKLASIIYQNNPLLCEQFWSNWESYTSPEDDPNSGSFPICCLLDSAHKLAVAALNEYNNQQITEDIFIPATAPFFRLLSSLSHTSNIVETTVGLLPDGMVRKSLLCCRLIAPTSGAESYNKNRAILLESLSTLTRIGSSKSCIEILRGSLEESERGQGGVLVDGPRVLGRILSGSDGFTIIKPILQIMARLLDGAPQRWALQLAREFITSQDSAGLARFLAPGSDTIHSAALVLVELIEHLTAVVFCDSFNDNDAVNFLHGLETGILCAGTTLASSLSVATASLTGRSPLSFETAQAILQSFTNFLKLIKTVIELHKSSRVRESAVEVRDILINALATSTGLGEAIAYYAATPVSLSLVIKMQNALDDHSFLRQVSDDADADAAKSQKYGAWHSVLSKQTETSDGAKAKQFLIDSIANINCSDFDTEGIQARGWTFGSNLLAPLHTAWSAIRLLSVWASQVEDIVRTHVEDLDMQSMPVGGVANELIVRLSPQSLLSSLAPSPIPCRNNSNISSLWESAGLSNFELLLPYLSSTDQQDVNSALATPKSATLDFLHACLIHVRSICPIETVADSMLFRAIYRSPRLSQLLADSIERTISLSKKRGGLGHREKREVLNGLLSLRILCTCVETSPTVADAILHLETNRIVPNLIKAASTGRDLLSSDHIFGSEESILQMRVASGCLSVLSSLWTTARSFAPGQVDFTGSRFAEVVDQQAPFITDLVTTVSIYANDANFESKIASSRDSECARCTMITYVSTALDILATELAYDVCHGGKCSNTALENFLLKDVIQSERFASFDGYQFATESTGIFATSVISGNGKISRPLYLLQCFPSVSNCHLSRDFYVNENLFDLASSIRWLADAGITGASDEAADILPRIAISYQLASCDLEILASWKRFSEIMVFFAVDIGKQSSSTGRDIATYTKLGPSAQRLLNFAQASLGSLYKNLEVVNKAQVDVSDDFMRSESYRMAKYLTGLFLFFLEMGAGSSEGSQVLTFDKLLDLLDLVTKTSELLFAVASPRAGSMQRSESLIEVSDNTSTIYNNLRMQRADSTSCFWYKVSCELERPLLASTVVISGLIEKQTNSSGSQRSRQNRIYNALCRVNSKVLQNLGALMKESNKKSSVEVSKMREYRNSLRCCISVFTELVARGRGADFSDAAYFKVLSETFREHEVLRQLVEHAVSSSTRAENFLSSKNGAPKDFSESRSLEDETENLMIVKSVLSLLYSVAESNDRELLSVLPRVGLSQLVVRNPLFTNSASANTNDSNLTAPRGYIVPRAKADISSQNGQSPSALFYEDDPVHEIWLACLKILQASLRSSSNWMGVQGTEGIGKHVFEMSVEFLRVHREKLLSCLKYCGSKLTRNALLEATHILALVAELSKRNTRDIFIGSCMGLYEDFVQWSRFVVVGISKFLGASGTSRELLLALQEYESSDSGSPGNDMAGLATPRHPLLAEGLPSAKHEAVKYSHFASRCCERVTKSDYEAASTVPSRLKRLSQERENDSQLERSCRLAVTNKFALQMEKAAADCLSQAISTIWRTHPISSSFHTFSENEVVKMDAMGLVKDGVIIAFRPSAAGNALTEYGGTRTQSFETLRFGRVCGSDSVNRTWRVMTLQQGASTTDGEKNNIEVVRATQLAGIEDSSMRKVVATYLPAPNSMESLETTNSLSLCHLILVLRWCHQQSLSHGGDELDHGFKATDAVRRVAEQTAALLGAELAIHDEIGSHVNVLPKERSQLDAQIFELFADKSILENVENSVPSEYNEGRLKDIIGPSAWLAIRPQITREVQRAWKEKQEKERRRSEKRALGSNWFSGTRRKGFTQKSAFRGLG